MAIDLSAATAAEMLINRLSLTDDAQLLFEESNVDTGWITKLTLTQEHDWDSVEHLNPQNKQDFLTIRVLDFTGFAALLKQSSAVQLEGYRYKIEKRFAPKGVTRVWTLRCELLGEVEVT